MRSCSRRLLEPESAGEEGRDSPIKAIYEREEAILLGRFDKCPVLGLNPGYSCREKGAEAAVAEGEVEEEKEEEEEERERDG